MRIVISKKSTKPLMFLFGLLSLTLSKDLNAQSNEIPSSDGILSYQVFGQGEPILIINGGPGLNSDGFDSFARELAAEGYQTIIFDQRGTGRSSLKDSTQISLDLMVEDMERLRQHLGFKDWVILGHSFGGILANAYAVKYPGSIRALIHSASGGMDLSILSAFQKGVDEHLSAEEKKLIEEARLAFEQEQNQENLSNYLIARARLYALDTSYYAGIAQRTAQVDMRINQMIWQQMREANFNLKSQLGQFNKPVLIIQGDQDIIPLEIATDMYRSFPKARLAILSHCRHYGWIDAKENYYLELNRFLKALD